MKYNPDTTEKYKDRYVAKCYSQLADVDYKETFSPTANMTSVHSLMQLVAQSGRNWNKMLHDYLCKNGFAQNPADHCVYSKQTENERIQ